jgi:murein DD-endopeptidase MepM/ murein hydrolase activator NlpD
MRSRLRSVPVLIAAFVASSCATTHSDENDIDRAVPYSMSSLSLCPGVSISNAPAASGSREILSYTPFTRIRGVSLARAPVDACVSSAYGPRSGGAGSFHDGVDLYTGAPRTVYAGGAGRIKAISDQRGYGLTIEINHSNGVLTRYAHLSSVASGLREGAYVSAGQPIAQTGRSGNATAVHLHYEMLVDGRPQDPLHAGD